MKDGAAAVLGSEEGGRRGLRRRRTGPVQTARMSAKIRSVIGPPTFARSVSVMKGRNMPETPGLHITTE